jgi:GT2 family glycosyltransferase
MAKRKRVRSNPKSQKINSSFSSNQLDIIIPVHQRFDLLQQCLLALPDACGDINYKVIIFDNGSPQEQADEFYSQDFGNQNIKVIRNKENIGFPRACNTGFNHGFSSLVFFLNDDVILDPGSVPLLVKEFDDPKIGIVGMKLVFPEHTDLPQDAMNRPAGKIQHIGLETNINADFVHLYLGWSQDHPKVNQRRNAYAVTGAAMMTRRQLFTRAGKFYEGYGRGTWEDVDFCLAVRSMGYNIIVVPEARGIHHTGATAVTYGLGYDLQGNKQIFLSRWKNHLDYTDWQY